MRDRAAPPTARKQRDKVKGMSYHTALLAEAAEYEELHGAEHYDESWNHDYGWDQPYDSYSWDTGWNDHEAYHADWGWSGSDGWNWGYVDSGVDDWTGNKSSASPNGEPQTQDQAEVERLEQAHNEAKELAQEANVTLNEARDAVNRAKQNRSGYYDSSKSKGKGKTKGNAGKTDKDSKSAPSKSGKGSAKANNNAVAKAKHEDAGKKGKGRAASGDAGAISKKQLVPYKGLGCSKCRRDEWGCGECRKKANIKVVKSEGKKCWITLP